MLTTRRLDALNAFLLHHPPRLLPLATDLRERQSLFESTIHGSSMAPAIPAGARLRVRLLGHQERCRRGDVVFYLADDGYMVHRVVCATRGGSDYILACGDARLAPDRPVRIDRVLGVVVAVKAGDDWVPPGPPIVVGPSYKRALRAITLVAMIVTLRASRPAARGLAGALLRLESFSRASIRYLRGGIQRKSPEH
jgi:hypothetical protein